MVSNSKKYDELYSDLHAKLNEKSHPKFIICAILEFLVKKLQKIQIMVSDFILLDLVVCLVK
jgi:hypothetical protein